MKKIDLTGRRFGRLTVLTEDGKNKWGNYIWKCKCDCGNIVSVVSGSLIKGYTTSCGCYRYEIQKSTNLKHGDKANHKRARLYNIWASMKERCLCETCNAFPYYGGRGITVCDEWKEYEAFRNWALSNGYDENAPHGNCTLDRINNDLGYFPSNCRWVSMKEQANNRRRRNTA